MKMIELLDSRRMIIVVVVLIVVCILVIIIEDSITDEPLAPMPKFPIDLADLKVKDKNKNNSIMLMINDQNVRTASHCWLEEEFSVIKQCEPCNEFEKKSKQLIACVLTGYKETINCKSFGQVYRSCDMTSRNFFIFQSFMIFISILSGIIVHKRQKFLDRKTFERIQRQIASGV